MSGQRFDEYISHYQNATPVIPHSEQPVGDMVTRSLAALNSMRDADREDMEYQLESMSKGRKRTRQFDKRADSEDPFHQMLYGFSECIEKTLAQLVARRKGGAAEGSTALKKARIQETTRPESSNSIQHTPSSTATNTPPSRDSITQGTVQATSSAPRFNAALAAADETTSANAFINRLNSALAPAVPQMQQERPSPGYYSALAPTVRRTSNTSVSSSNGNDKREASTRSRDNADNVRSLSCLSCAETDMNLHDFLSHLHVAHNTTAFKANLAFKCICGKTINNSQEARFHKYACRASVLTVVPRSNDR